MSHPQAPGLAPDVYSGLQVVDNRAENAPEVDLRHQPDKEVAYTDVPKDRRRLCGMRRPIAFLIFAVVGLIAVGAIVGGAVGGTLAASGGSSDAPVAPPNPTTPSPNSPFSSSTSTSSSTQTSTSTSASTSTSTASPSETPIAEGEGTYTCPESDNANYTTSAGTGSQMFIQLCDVDWPAGITAVVGSNTDLVEDLSVVLAYSLIQCIDQCAVYNLNNSPGCMAVTYGANITKAQDRGVGGNCWLKSARGENLADDSGQVQAAYMD